MFQRDDGKYELVERSEPDHWRLLDMFKEQALRKEFQPTVWSVCVLVVRSNGILARTTRMEWNRPLTSRSIYRQRQRSNTGLTQPATLN